MEGDGLLTLSSLQKEVSDLKTSMLAELRAALKEEVREQIKDSISKFSHFSSKYVLDWVNSLPHVSKKENEG
jgi:dsDNA-specific endonuclease/ATPase MutS2